MRYVVGDLTQAPESIIAHGCNAQGVMGSGVAKAIRERFPFAYEEYRRAYEGKSTQVVVPLQVGMVIWAMGHKNCLIANCITQEFYGSDGTQYCSYEGIRSCFKNIHAQLYYSKRKSLAIPKIGAGLGGGDWAIIENIINTELKSLPDVDVVCYVLNENEIPSTRN